MPRIQHLKAQLKRVKKDVDAIYGPAPEELQEPEPEGCEVVDAVEELQLELHGVTRRLERLERIQARTTRPTDQEIVQRLLDEDLFAEARR